MLSVKVTTVGSSEGVILTKEARALLNVQKGDLLYLTPAPDGALRISAHDPVFARQMALAEQIMHEDRDALLALSKR